MLESGTSTDEADVARLAIKIVGYKDGAWHQIYVQSFHPWGDTRGEIGSFTGYAIVSGLLRYLRQQDNVDRRPYAKNYGVARVSEAAFDNMTQTYTLTPLHPTTKIPAPTLRSRDEIKADLMPHTTPYTRVGFSAIAGLQGRRSKCDGCHHVDKNQQGGGGRTEVRTKICLSLIVTLTST